MKQRINKTLTAILKIVISIGALLYVFSKIEFQQIFEIAVRADYLYVVAALIIFILSKVIASVRLNRFFSKIEIIISEGKNLKLYLLGMFYNLFLPGGIGGDGYKIYILNRIFEVKTGRIFWAVFLDRLSGVIALFCLAMLFAGFIDLRLGFNPLILTFTLVPLSLAGFYVLITLFFRHFKNVLIKVLSLSAAVQILQILCAFLIFTALGGEKSITDYLFLFLISSIVSMLPFTIGGAGSREITFLFGSAWLGLDENLSIALSLIFYLITLLSSIWGIIFSIQGGYFERILKPSTAVSTYC